MPAGLFDAKLRYGSSTMWMVSFGIRLRAGAMHDRMGRYGAALPPDVGNTINVVPTDAKKGSVYPAPKVSAAGKFNFNIGYQF